MSDREPPSNDNLAMLGIAFTLGVALAKTTESGSAMRQWPLHCAKVQKSAKALHAAISALLKYTSGV